MTEPTSRRERKKAATRHTIATTARRMFLERGYDAVGIRDIADEADVAVTTLFAHFPCKEALLFEQDEDFERQLVSVVTDRAHDDPLIPALHAQITALVRHSAAARVAPVWRMIEQTPALREYEAAIRMRHADSLAAAIAADAELARSTVACRATARFVIDAYSIARQSPRPYAALGVLFEMIEAAWNATEPSRRSREDGGGRRTRAHLPAP